MPTANDANVVVFDFDLTLTRWETAHRFFRACCAASRGAWPR